MSHIIVLVNWFVLDVPIISVTVTNTNEATLGGVYLLICSSTSLEINFIYTSTFQWYHNGAILVGRNPRVLHLSSLALSDVGNYTCRVTATSRALGQPIVTDSLPHTVILRGKHNKNHKCYSYKVNVSNVIVIVE